MVQSHVIAMQGPFSRDFNAALYDQLPHPHDGVKGFRAAGGRGG